jgi:hypothetical protein
MSIWQMQGPNEARRVLARGIDPSDQMKLDKISASVAATNTFKAVVEEWYVKAAKKELAPATLNKSAGCWTSLISRSATVRLQKSCRTNF